MNTKGIKFLAVLAVLAMAFAAFAVIAPADDSDAAATATVKYTGATENQGPFDFTATMQYNTVDYGNVALHNDISVLFKETKDSGDNVIGGTYTITGTINKQIIKASTGVNISNQAFVDLYGTEYLEEKGLYYLLAFGFNAGAGDKIKIGTEGAQSPALAAGYEDCSIALKQAGVSDVVVTKADTSVLTYKIDTTGVKFSTTTLKEGGYVALENAKANAGVTSGTDAAGGKWDITGGVLTLDNYNGKEYFAGDFTTVKLIGDNKITLKVAKAAMTAINADAGLTITNDSGVSSLTIVIDSADDQTVKGIVSGGQLSISGVNVDVTISGKTTTATGLQAAAGVDIFNSVQNISVVPSTFAVDKEIYGYKIAGPVAPATSSIRASEISIYAGMCGIYSNASVTMEKVDLDITATQKGIEVGALSISQESYVDVIASGPVVGTEPTYAVKTGEFTNKSHSLVNVNGMLITGVSTNYAGLNNTGNMLIKGAFTNSTEGIFVNSGTIAVIGSIDVAAGEFQNDGTVQTIKGYTNNVTTITPTAGTTGITVETLKIDTAEQQADGTLYVSATVTYLNGGEAFGAGYVIPTYYGTATYDGLNLKTMSLRGTYVDDGKQYVSMINVSYSAKAGEPEAYEYTFITSGTLQKIADKSSFAISGSNKLNAPVAILKDEVTTAKILATSGAIVNNDTMIFNVQDGAVVLNKGSLVNNGTVAAKAKLTVTEGAFANNGSFTTEADLEIGSKGNFTGPIVIAEGKAVEIEATGNIDSAVTYAGSYTKGAGATATTIAYDNAVEVKGKGITFTTNVPADDNTGVFKVTAFGASANTTFTLQKGKVILASAIGAKGALYALANTTVDVDPMGSVVTGVIGIQDGAKINMWIDSDPATFVYGKITYVISFANEGYTYYGSLAFALEKAPEGETLTLGSDAEIAKDTAVKAGITLLFSENTKLTIKGESDDKPVTFTMGEGASFKLVNNSTVAFQYAVVSGTFTYEENAMVLDAVVFSAVESQILSQAEIANVSPAALDMEFDVIKKGTIELDDGYVVGAVTLDAVMDGTKVKNAGEIYIGADAYSEAVINFGDNPAKTKVVIDGTMYVAAATNLVSPITGDGYVLLADGVEVSFVNKVAQSITIGNGSDGFEFAVVKWVDDETVATDETITVKSVAATSTEEAYVLIGGDVTDGIITAIGNVATDGLVLHQNAAADPATLAVVTVPLEAAFTVLKDGANVVLDINGIVMVAGEFNYYTDDTDKYGVIAYDVTYDEDGYTVYAKMSSAVSEAPAGTSFTIDKEVTVDTIILQNGNTITVTGKDGVLKVTTYAIVGTPATTLGAVDTIVGKVLLEPGAFAVVFENADVSEAKFVYGDDEKTAKTSNYSINNITYFDVYAPAGEVELEDVEDTVGVPKIEGYKFQGWVTYVEDAFFVGETDVYAKSKAVQYKITIKSVSGVVYKVAGSSDVILDSPFYVDYGTVVNAIAASGYQGTTQSWTVDKDMTITASGFTPIPEPEPTPEPTAGGLSLTDILLIVLVILCAVMVIIVVLRLNRS